MHKLISLRDIGKLGRSHIRNENIVKHLSTSSEYQDVSWENAKPFEDIPSDLMIPLIGTAWTLLPIVGRYSSDRVHWANMDKRKRHGRIFREKFGPFNTVVCFSTKDMEKIMMTEGRFPSRGEFSTLKAYRASRDKWYSSGGLLVLEGFDWAELRRKVQNHVLRPKALNSYYEQIQDVASDFICRISEIKDENNEVPALLDELYKWALESVSMVALNTRLGCLESNLPPDSDAMKIVKAVNSQIKCMSELEPFAGKLPYWKLFPTPTWKEFVKAGDTYAEFAFKYINKAVEDLKDNDGKEPLTMLQSMMTTEDLSVGDAMVFVSDLMMAGIETTSHATAFLLYHLAKNPDKQENMRKEILSMMPNAEDRMTPQMYDTMRYTRGCLHESLRLIPVVSGNVRVLGCNLVLSGYRVPAGSLAVMPNVEVYNDEKHFRNADKFYPERWVNRAERPKPFSFIPFGFGRRSCIGKRLAELETITLTTQVLRKFRLEYHFEDVGYLTKLINTPDKPLRINFIPI